MLRFLLLKLGCSCNSQWSLRFTELKPTLKLKPEFCKYSFTCTEEFLFVGFVLQPNSNWLLEQWSLVWRPSIITELICMSFWMLFYCFYVPNFSSVPISKRGAVLIQIILTKNYHTKNYFCRFTLKITWPYSTLILFPATIFISSLERFSWELPIKTAIRCDFDCASKV